MTLHDLISNFSRIEYLEFCAEQSIVGDSAQEMSWFVAKYQDDYGWVEEWINKFRGEEEARLVKVNTLSIDLRFESLDLLRLLCDNAGVEHGTREEMIARLLE